MIAAVHCLRSKWVAPGPNVEEFENELCTFLDLPQGHAVCVSSGTSALALALSVLQLRGKTIAIPAYACSSLRHAVAFAGGHSIIVDSSKSGPNLDPEIINQISPDAVIVPHLYGIPVDVQKISSKIRVIEDCAQSIGARVNGVHAGSIGDASIFSFYASKLLTSGGTGGAFVSKDKALVDAARDYREFDCRHDLKTRFNFQLSDLAAAIGRVQLRRLPVFIKKRQDLFDIYRNAGITLLGDLDPIEKIQPVRFRAIALSETPSDIIERLNAKGVASIVPIEDWELNGPATQNPNAANLCRTTVSLPIYPTLSLSTAKKIAKWGFQ